MTVPPIPADCDLRDFYYTPMYRSRLFGSSFHARVSDAGWRAGVTLWLKSWDQVPAGSLPDDEIDLCRLAELGRDMKAWRKVSKEALWGWNKCDDGRLYHETVAIGINEAWQRKIAQRNRTAAAREAALRKRKQQDDLSSVTDVQDGTDRDCERGGGASVTEIATEPVTESNRREGNIRKKDSELRSAPSDDPRTRLFETGKALCGKSAGGLIGKLLDAKGGNIAAAQALINLAQGKAEPREYLAAAAKQRDGPGQRAPKTNPYFDGLTQRVPYDANSSHDRNHPDQHDADQTLAEERRGPQTFDARPSSGGRDSVFDIEGLGAEPGSSRRIG